MRIGVVKTTGVSGSLHLLEGRLKAAFQQNFQTILGILSMETRKTARLILRPWALIDAEVVYEQARNPKIEEMCGWPPCACWRNADLSSSH